jgi:hypothetical protein
MMPPVMQQPYFFLPPVLNNNIPLYAMPPGLDNNNPINNISNNTIPNNSFQFDNIPNNNVQGNATETADNGTNEPTTTGAVKNDPPPEPTNNGTNTVERHMGATQQPRTLQRRRSMLDTILSALALPNKYDIARPHSTFVPLDQPVGGAAVEQPITYSDISVSNDSLPTSTSSSTKPPTPNDNIEIHLNSEDESSTKLRQSMNAFQIRDYIWCYKSSDGLWVAFDVKNQNKIDNHYAKSMTTGSPDDVVVLTKQSNLPCPLYVSTKASKVWYNAPKPIVFDIKSLKSNNSRFVVSNEPRKRSKSVDVTKLLSGIFKM